VKPVTEFSPSAPSARVRSPAMRAGGSRASIPRLLDLLVAATGAVALAPIVAALLRSVLRPWPETLFDNDLATIEVAVREVIAFERAVGAYSRFGWAQPGPAGFVALVPSYLLLGQASFALIVGALLMHAAAAGCALLLAWRYLGRTASLAVALGVLVLPLAFRSNELANPWPPFQVVAPVFFLLTAASAVAVNRSAPLGAVLLAATIAVQTHLGTAPVVGAVLLVCLAVRHFAPRLEVARSRRSRAFALAAGLSAGALWIPPLVEQLGPHRGGEQAGNMSLIARTFRHRDGHRDIVGLAGGRELVSASVDDCARALHRLFESQSQPAARPEEDRSGRPTRVLLLALVAAAAIAAWRRDRIALAMLAVASAALAAGLFAAASIVGEPLPYLVTFLVPVIVSVGAATLASVGGAVVACLRARGAGTTARFAAASVILAAVLRPAWATTIRDRRELWLNTPPGLETVVDAARGAAAAGTKPGGCARVGAVGDAWVWASGVVLALEKSGLSPAIDDSLVTLFGKKRLGPGRACVELRLVDRRVEKAPAGEVLASIPAVDLVQLKQY